MMKRVKRIWDVTFKIVMVGLVILVIAMKVDPEKTSDMIGFRFYTVLTDSMEPEIPTFSLVFSEKINEYDAIEPNTIVTFKADRFDEEVLLTHYFRETQEKDGEIYYRTQGATAESYDNYETPRSDIVGRYKGHIPYVGKTVLFMQSKFVYIWFGEIIVIMLINKLVRAKWEEKNNMVEE